MGDKLPQNLCLTVVNNPPINDIGIGLSVVDLAWPAWDVINGH